MHPQIHAHPVGNARRRSLADELLAQLAAVKVENARLRRRNRELERSRDRWRREARTWKWGALRAR